MDNNYPTAADYANATAHDAINQNRKLEERIAVLEKLVFYLAQSGDLYIPWELMPQEYPVSKK